MEVEAALAPPSVRLNTSVRRYAFRALKLPKNHPISEEIEVVSEFPKSPDLRFNKKSKKSTTSKKPRPTQISRIWESIQNLVDLELLKLIEHYRYPP